MEGTIALYAFAAFDIERAKLRATILRPRKPGKGEPKSIPCHECGKHIQVRALKDINIRGDKVFCDKCARRLQRASEKGASRKSALKKSAPKRMIR